MTCARMLQMRCIRYRSTKSNQKRTNASAVGLSTKCRLCCKSRRPCVYRIFDSVWTQRTDGVSSRSDEGPVQADSRRPGFALQVESNAGSRNLGPTATDQCAPTTDAEKAAPEQYRSFCVCLALSLVPFRPWRDCDYQARNHHSLAPSWVSSVLALAITQPCWQAEGLG